jgi:hypothetical protein
MTLRKAIVDALRIRGLPQISVRCCGQLSARADGSACCNDFDTILNALHQVVRNGSNKQNKLFRINAFFSVSGSVSIKPIVGYQLESFTGIGLI